ncbi:MAG: pitrilysin family protein [Vampirovibrionales bacterium]|nr:pitrilysin family protein [Vampirovibrionales bacterium]
MTTATLPTRIAKEAFHIPFGEHPATLARYSNGYTFILVPKSGGVFNISTWVRTGSIHETDVNSGISHFLEHLMFKGTERFAPGVFDREMESMGAIINAATWKDFTFYYITGPNLKVVPEGQVLPFPKALDMHADMMTGAALPDDEIGPAYNPETEVPETKRERGVVIEEIGMRDDQPWTKVYNALNTMMYPDGHPYRRDVIGTRHIVGTIPRDSIVSYHQQWYNPSQFITVVVGDFDFDTLESQVLEAFHKIPAPTGNQNGPTSEGVWQQWGDCTFPTEERFATRTSEVTTTFFIQAYHGPKAANLKDSIALDVAATVLGGGLSSRFHQTLVEQLDPPEFSFVSCGQYQFKLGNVFFIQGNVVIPEAKASIERVQSLMNDVLTANPLTEAECQRVIKKMRASFAETSETASGIADAIGESLTVTDGLDYYLHYMDTLNTLTAADINAAVQTYLRSDQAYLSLLEPEEG